MSRRRKGLPKPSPSHPQQQPTTKPPQTPAATVTTTISESHYSGPLPPASELEAYNRVDPTFANRVVSMAEAFAEHARRLEAEAMSAERSAQN